VTSRQGSSFFRVFPGFCRIGRLSNSRSDDQMSEINTSNLARSGISDVWESDLTSDNMSDRSYLLTRQNHGFWRVWPKHGIRGMAVRPLWREGEKISSPPNNIQHEAQLRLRWPQGDNFLSTVDAACFRKDVFYKRSTAPFHEQPAHGRHKFMVYGL